MQQNTQIEEIRRLVSFPFVSYTGVQWTKSQINAYNMIQKRINCFILENRRVPEYLLNGSHNLFTMFSLREDK